MQRLDLAGHGLRRADQPAVAGQVFDGDVGIGHRRVVLQEWQRPESLHHLHAVVAGHPRHGAVDGQLPGFLVGVGDQHLAHHAPVLAVRRPARAGGPFGDGVPVAGQIGGVEVQAHRDEAPLAGPLQGVRPRAQPGDADGRMRRLHRLQEGREDLDLGGRASHRPVLALLGEGLLGAHQAQDHLQRLPHHLADVLGLDAELRPVGGN